MNFITMPIGGKSPTTLSLHNIGNGVVEVWAYTISNDDGYRIGFFKNGMFVAAQIPNRAETLLNLTLTSTGHLVTKLQ